MEGGVITQAGSHEELLTSGTTFEQLMNAHRDAITVMGASHQDQEKCQEVGRVDNEQGHHGCDPTNKNSNEEICETGFAGQQLTPEEHTEMGNAGWELFLDYIIISKGLLLQFLSFIALIGSAAFLAAASYWLAIASEIPSIADLMLVGVYTALSLLSAAFIYIRSLLVAHHGLKASKAFFSSFTSAIFNAPMSFFDSTPVGRILTRVSCVIYMYVRLEELKLYMDFKILYKSTGCP